jgi:hypothetical protein
LAKQSPPRSDSLHERSIAESGTATRYALVFSL